MVFVLLGSKLLNGYDISANSVICRTKYPSTFPNYLVIRSA